MKKVQKQLLLVNTLGAISYFFLLTAFVPLLALLFSGVAHHIGGIDHASSMTPPVSGDPADQGSNLLAKLFLFIIVIVMGLVTLVVTIGLPYFVGKYASRVTHWLMKTAKLPQTLHQLLLLKSMLAILPLIGMLSVSFTPYVNEELYGPLFVATFVGSVLSLVLFILQHSLAKKYKDTIAKVW